VRLVFYLHGQSVVKFLDAVQDVAIAVFLLRRDALAENFFSTFVENNASSCRRGLCRCETFFKSSAKTVNNSRCNAQERGQCRIKRTLETPLRGTVRVPKISEQ
jgi:hypothetical protein